MSNDVLLIALSAAVSSGGAVWAVFSVMVASIKEDVKELRSTATDAHKRLNRHIEKNHA